MPPANKTYPFTPDNISAFVCRLSGGRSLQAVCRDADMPAAHMVYRRMRQDPVFKAQVEAVRDPATRGRARGWAGPGQWSQALADGILAGLREGISLTEICRSPQCPVGGKAVHRWRATKPEFAAAYAAACAPRQTAQGLKLGRGRRGGYDPHLVHLIADRLLEGRTLQSISLDPDMPSLNVMGMWARRRPEFRLALERARRAQLDVLLDAVIEARDVPHRSGPAMRRLTAVWRFGYRPFGAEPIAAGGVSWAATQVDGTRRGRGLRRARGVARGGRRQSVDTKTTKTTKTTKSTKAARRAAANPWPHRLCAVRVRRAPRRPLGGLGVALWLTGGGPPRDSTPRPRRPPRPGGTRQQGPLR